MKKIRAEPGKHRLDNGFMKWSQETIEANKKTGHGIEKAKSELLEQGEDMSKYIISEPKRQKFILSPQKWTS